VIGTTLAPIEAMKKKPVRGATARASVAEVLDRVLDRGIVIDAWVRVSLAGIRLIDVDARVVVASIQTYAREWDSISPPSTDTRSAHAEPRASTGAGRSRRRHSRRAERTPRAPLTLQCGQGCTFTRSAARKPTTVRCASDRSQTCAVTPLVAA
jgi:hypothetical protein